MVIGCLGTGLNLNILAMLEDGNGKLPGFGQTDGACGFQLKDL